MVEFRWWRMNTQNLHVDYRGFLIVMPILQYRYKVQDIMQANIADWPWSDWIDVPTVTEGEEAK